MGKLIGGLYGTKQRFNRFDAVNLGLVKSNLGKIDSIFFFQKNDQLHGIDGT